MSFADSYAKLLYFVTGYVVCMGRNTPGEVDSFNTYTSISTVADTAEFDGHL